MAIRRYITVRDQYEGWHSYNDAPDAVSFLRHEHRHIFKWDATIEVFHDDRELEFFLVKLHVGTQLKYWLNTKKHRDLGSCEMQAEEILNYMLKEYGEDRAMWVTVSEDGESDGTVKWIPDSKPGG